MKGSHERIRAFNKRIVNPLFLRLAGKNHVPFAVVYHVGRRSGKRFETPVAVEPMRDGFVIALPYGPEVDWLRNLAAAGGGSLLWHHKKFDFEKPELMEPSKALVEFSPFGRAFLWLTHTGHFLRVKYRGVAPAG